MQSTNPHLAAFDYFLPFSAKWPAPSDPAFKKTPTRHDFPTTNAPPDVACASTSSFGRLDASHLAVGEQPGRDV